MDGRVPLRPAAVGTGRPPEGKLNASASIRALIAVLGLTTAATALAQGAGIVLPGQVERQFRLLPEPRRSTELPATPSPAKAMPPGAEAIRFTLRRIEVVDATQLDVDELDELIAPYLAREISLADLYELADKLGVRYREKGFLLSQVLVPAQEIKDGQAKLQAVEGYVDQLVIEGGAADERDLVTRYAMKIRAARPLTDAVLERYMLLINDLPGVFAYATLSPSEEQFAAADLHIHLSERTLDAGWSIDNRGGRVLGTERLILDVAAAGLFGRRENTAAKVVFTPGGELNYAALQHDHPISDDGGRLSLAVSATRARPREDSFVPLDLETRSQSFDVAYGYPLVRSRNRNLLARARLSGHDGEERVFGVKDREDRVRSLRLGFTYDTSRRAGTTVVDVEASFGLNTLGASDGDHPLLTRPGGRIAYQKLNLFAAHLMDLSERWSVLAAVTGQFAYDPLLSSELFAFGGEPFGRGYDPSELVGDHGAASKIELRYSGQWPLAHAPVPYQIYGFHDLGRVWSRVEGDAEGDRSAASIGVGARVLFGRLNGFVEVARPLTREVAAEQSKGARVYAGLSARL